MTGTVVPCTVCQDHVSGIAHHERCAAHVRQVAAILPRITEEQVGKALQLIADGGIVLSEVPGVWHVVSSDGAVIYPAGATFCGCPSQGVCYHNAAVIIAAAAASTLAAIASS